MRIVTLSLWIRNIFIKQFQGNWKLLSFYFYRIGLYAQCNVANFTDTRSLHSKKPLFSNKLQRTFEEKYTLYPWTWLIWGEERLSILNEYKWSDADFELKSRLWMNINSEIHVCLQNWKSSIYVKSLLKKKSSKFATKIQTEVHFKRWGGGNHFK